MHSWLAEGPQKPQSAHLALVPPPNEKFTVRPSLSHRQCYLPERPRLALFHKSSLSAPPPPVTVVPNLVQALSPQFPAAPSVM